MQALLSPGVRRRWRSFLAVRRPGAAPFADSLGQPERHAVGGAATRARGGPATACGLSVGAYGTARKRPDDLKEVG
jgi:hypothetical protein